MPRLLDQIDGMTYRLPMLEDEAEIGNLGASKFEPHLKLKRWGGECFMAIEPALLIPDARLEVQADKLVFSNDDMSFLFYGRPPTEQFELGIVELEIVLHKRPATNKIVLNIESRGLDFFYQPELTQEEVDEGCERPENIVGSYAVYHSTKSGNQYKAGKAFHIPRPEVVDSKGWRIWADQKIVGGQQIITIPQYFLDKAKYPIYHVAGDTFGYTSVGGTSGKFYDAVSMGASPSGYTPGSGGTVTGASIYAKRRSISGEQVKMGLYDDADDSFVANTDTVAVNSATPQWWGTTFAGGSGEPSIAASSHTLALAVGPDADDEINYYFDASGGPKTRRDITAWGSLWPDPAVWADIGTWERVMSLYCTYTPSAGEEKGPISSSVIIGVVASATRTGAFTSSPSVIVGELVTATRVAAFTRASSVIAGVLATATKGWGRSVAASVAVGVVATASKAWARSVTASVIVGVVATATRAAAFARSATALIGVVATVTKGFGLTVISSVVVGMTVTASKAWGITVTSSVIVGVVASASAGWRRTRDLHLRVITAKYRTLRVITAKNRTLRVFTSKNRVLRVQTAKNRTLRVITAKYRQLRIILGGD